MPDLDRRAFLKLGALGVGLGLGARSRTQHTPPPTAGGGGATQTPVPGGDHLGGEIGERFQVDVATTLNAIPEPEVRPQFCYVTGSNNEKGVYTNVLEEDMPVHLRFGGFELAIADALGDVPERDEPLQYILIRSGSEKGIYVNVESKPYAADSAVAELAVADVLADIEAPDQFPAIDLITGGGSAKGVLVDTGEGAA